MGKRVSNVKINFFSPDFYFLSFRNFIRINNIFIRVETYYLVQLYLRVKKNELWQRNYETSSETNNVPPTKLIFLTRYP